MRCRTLTIVFCTLLLLPAVSGAQDRLALVIGNGKYTHIDPLANPPNDVVLVSRALEKVGFKVTLIVDADKREMIDSARKFADTLDDSGKNTVGVFYYAGHGVSYRGENWLIPVGADIKQGTDIEYDTLSANRVLRMMEDARNATDIMILDACRNSPFRNFSLSGTRAVAGGMSRMEIAPTGSFIAYSTAPGAVAYDGDGRYSPFAEAFAFEIENSAYSIGDMMIEVRNKVKEKTARLGSRPQTPWDSSSLTGRFVFNPQAPSGSVAALPTPPPQESGQASQPSGVSADTRFWTSIENSTDPQEFEIYLQRYPDGQYADLARLRKERLNKKPEVPTVSTAQTVSSGSMAPAADTRAQSIDSGFTGASGDDEAAKLCRQFAGGDPEIFAECMDEYAGLEDGGMPPVFGQPDFGSFPSTGMPGGQTGQFPQQAGASAIWYDDQYNQWQVTLNGASFSATTFMPGSGQVTLRGQTQGYAVSYAIFDAVGQQIGYGQGTMTDATHLAVMSYWSNGAFLGSGQFHINHPPN